MHCMKCNEACIVHSTAPSQSHPRLRTHQARRILKSPTCFLSTLPMAASCVTLSPSSNTHTPATATTTRTHLHALHIVHMPAAVRHQPFGDALHHAYAQIFKSIQIFKVHEIRFILMGAIANLDEFYPPEEKIRTEFIKKVEAAERRVVEGKFTQYTPEEFEKSFL